MQMNLKRMLHLNGIKRTLNLFLINHVFVGTKPLACNMKRKLLRGIGCPVGDGTTIVGPIECKGSIAIGKNCWIGKTVGSMEMVPSKLATTAILDQRLRFKRADTQLEIEPEEPVRARFITR